jgi:hypothetical protein
VFLLTILIPFLSTAHAVQWANEDDPSRLSGTYSYSVDTLPLSAQLSTIPWSDTYWPDQNGSIDNRWNQSHPVGFNYTSPTLAVAKTLSRAQLAQLSPAEKYDLYSARYDYPLTGEVHTNSYVTPSAPDWSGICDGWSMAALQFSEPKAVDVTNPDGLVIPFGSSDVKAILSYAMSYHFRVRTQQAGTSCPSGTCNGLNAGSFHVALTNQIGLKHEGFIMDRSTTAEIWNQPVYGYKLAIVGSARPEAGVRGVHVQGEVYYVDELDQPSYTPVLNTTAQKLVTMQVDYTLDIDQNGNIIGGAFSRRSSRPDFVWFPASTFQFSDYFAGLSEIYHP